MSRGRRGHGAGFGGGACPRRISRFLEPCLLLLLRDDAAHGYNLLDAVRQFGFTPGTIDTSVLYRILRELEDGGWVRSQWHTAGTGPRRRVYSVTPDGEEYLAAWIDDLRCARDEIDQFVEIYTRQEGGRGSTKPEQRIGEGDHVLG
jgi:PadR family transcriptional regulator, regulatory protein PadR